MQTAALSGALRSPLTIEDWANRAVITVAGEGVQRLLAPAGNGEFTVAGLRPGSYSLSVDARGHASRVIDDIILPAEGLDLGPVTLTPERVPFRGEVRLVGAATHELVVVRARRNQLEADTALSDTAGRFTLDLTPETHTLEFAREGYQAHPEVTLTWNTDAGSFDISSPLEEPPFLLTPNPTASVHGEVSSSLGALQDWPSRAFVTLVSADEVIRRLEPVLDAQNGRGRYRISGVPPGNYSLSISARGHNPFSVTVPLGAGENPQAGIVLTPDNVDPEESVTLRGVARLEDAQNGGHTDITVRARVGNNLVATTVTDGSGNFAFLAARDDHVLSFDKPGYESETIEADWIEDEDEPAGGHFDARGQGRLDAYVVTLDALDTGRFQGQLSSPLDIEDWSSRAFATIAGDGLQRIAPVAANGHFDFSGLRPGFYTVAVDARGHFPFVLEDIEVVAPSDPNDIRAIRLTPEELGFTSTVRLTGLDRHSGVLVRASRGQLLADTALTDDNGQFLMTLTPETHMLTFSKDGFQDRPTATLRWSQPRGVFDVEALPGEPPFVLTPVPMAQVSGEVATTLPDGLDDWPGRGFVTLVGQETRIAPLLNAQGGRGLYQVSGLPPGRYDLHVSARGHVPGLRQLTLVNGQNPQPLLTLTVEANDAPVTLRGTAALAGAGPGGHADIAARLSVGNNLVAATLTAPDGTFAALVSRDRHTLVLTRDGYGPVTVPNVRWVEDGDEPQGGYFLTDQGRLDATLFTLAAEDSAAFAGQLTSPLVINDWSNRAYVSLTGSENQVTGVAADGSFRFDGLRPGRYTIAVSARGHLPVVLDSVDLQESDPDPVLVPLTPEQVPFLSDVELLGRQDHSGAVIRAHRNQLLADTAISDNEGAFLLSLTPENHTLTFYRQDYQDRLPVRLVWNTGAGRFDLEGQGEDEPPFALLPVPSSVVSGTIRSSLGDLVDWPSRGFVSLVGVDDPDFQRLAALLNDGGNGRYQVAGVPPGAYALHFSARGHVAQTRPVTLSPGNNAQPLVTLAAEVDEPDAAVLMRGTVLRDDAQDGQHGDTDVRASIGVNLVATTRTAPDGRFVLSTSRDTHTLVIARSGYRLTTLPVTWVDSENEPQGGYFTAAGVGRLDQNAIDLESVPVTGMVRVRPIVAPEAPWIPNAQATVRVTLTGADAFRVEEAVRSGTTHSFTGLRAGTYLVRAERDGFAAATATVVLATDDANPAVTDLTTPLTDLSRAGLALAGVTIPSGQLSPIVVVRGAVFDGAALTGVYTDRDFTGARFVAATLRGTDFRRATLFGANFLGADMSFANLQGADLRVANLSATNLDNAVFVGNEPVPDPPCDPNANRPAVRLDDARLAGATLSNTTLRGVDLGGVDLGGTDLTSANLTSACLQDANLSLADFTDAILISADLSDATLVNTLLRDTELDNAIARGAAFNAAIIDGADLRGAQLQNANFSGASLTDATLTGANATDAQFNGTNMDDVTAVDLVALRGGFNNASFISSDLTRANLTSGSFLGAIFDGSDLDRTIFTSGTLPNQLFHDCTLSGVVFTGAQLAGSTFVANRFSGTGPNFTNADLEAADFTGEDVHGSNFSGADLSGAQFVRATIDGATWTGATLDDASLFDVEGRGVNFAGVSMQRANLAQGQFSEGDFTNADLYRATLDRGVFVSAAMSGVNMNGVSARQATFRYADMSALPNDQTILLGADLSDADLVGVDLTDVRANDIVLRRALIALSTLDGADFDDADFTGAFFNGNNTAHDAVMTDAIFRDATIRDTEFHGADLQRADFTDTIIDNGTSFSGARVNGNLGVNVLDVASIVSSQRTSIFCNDGRNASHNYNCRTMVPPFWFLDNTGDSLSSNGEALPTSAPNWLLPSATCVQGGDYRDFISFVVRNKSDDVLRFTAYAQATTAHDLWLHEVEPEWDPSDPSDCIRGDDDGAGLLNPRIRPIELNPGESTTVVVSNRNQHNGTDPRFNLALFRGWAYEAESYADFDTPCGDVNGTVVREDGSSGCYLMDSTNGDATIRNGALTAVFRMRRTDAGVASQQVVRLWVRDYTRSLGIVSRTLTLSEISTSWSDYEVEFTHTRYPNRMGARVQILNNDAEVEVDRVIIRPQ